jgi:hypothetical protein
MQSPNWNPGFAVFVLGMTGRAVAICSTAFPKSGLSWIRRIREFAALSDRSLTTASACDNDKNQGRVAKLPLKKSRINLAELSSGPSDESGLPLSGGPLQEESSNENESSGRFLNWFECRSQLRDLLWSQYSPF